MIMEAEKPDMSAAPTIFVIDDDEDVRTSLSRLLRAAGWQVETFASAGDFLSAPPALVQLVYCSMSTCRK